MQYSEIQKQRLEIMRTIAEDISNEDIVLKGGTGLLLCYELDRFSEDMDFDGYGRFNLERTQRIISKAFEKQGTTVTQVIVKKDTPTTKRFMYHYEVTGSPQYSYPLKIEFSFRQHGEITQDQLDIIDGIKTYRIEVLAKKKLQAFLDRTAPRDIYDVEFLSDTFPQVFSKEMIKDILKIDMESLVTRFESDKIDDMLLADVDGYELVCRLYENLLLRQKDFESGSTM